MWFLFTQGLALIIMAPLLSGAIKVIFAAMEVFPDKLSEAETEALILDSFNLPLLFVMMGLFMVMTFAFLIPSVALLLRRFLDANIEAKWFWILLVGCFVPFLGPTAALSIVVIAGFVPGTPGPNRFGDDPRAAPETVFAAADEATRTWPTN